MVPCDFIDLTEGEAFLICEQVGPGGVFLGHDSRLTISELLADTVESALEDFSVAGSSGLLDYWRDHHLDPTDLPDRLKSLTSRQAQRIITAAKKFWKLDEKGDSSEAQELIDVGLVRHPT